MIVKPSRVNENLLSFFENKIGSGTRNVSRDFTKSPKDTRKIGRKFGKNKKSQNPTFNKDSNKNSDRLFENLPELIRPIVAASALGISVSTIYDWRYRHNERKIPKEFFVKVNRSLLIRTDILRKWIASQNPSQNEGE